MSCACKQVASSTGPVWRPGDGKQPLPTHPDGGATLFRPDVLAHIEDTIKALDSELRELSLDIHSHPELRYEEHHAHDVLTAFMSKHGFEVTRHYHLETAWKAEFSHGRGGRTIGINSEMDALPGIGHACGHNLIAISGVAVAIAIKVAIQQFNLTGKVLLLGTPAEEFGFGKIALLEKGAYKEMAACLMCHPAPGPVGSVSLSGSLALRRVVVEYLGRTAHAALSPWEGRNALDAAVLSYNNISALRQQLLPTHRVHGMFEGTDWTVNIIPDNAKMRYVIRAPSRAEVETTLKRVIPCFEAAGLATGCEVKITDAESAFDLRQNEVLGGEVAHIVTSKYGAIDYEWGIKSASTDFGNVGYELPSLHPGFAIPSVDNGGNHTAPFAQAAATIEAHNACLDVSKALAATGVRVLIDDEFYLKVKAAFDADALLREKTSKDL